MSPGSKVEATCDELNADDKKVLSARSVASVRVFGLGFITGKLPQTLNTLPNLTYGTLALTWMCSAYFKLQYILIAK